MNTGTEIHDCRLFEIDTDPLGMLHVEFAGGRAGGRIVSEHLVSLIIQKELLSKGCKGALDGDIDGFSA